MPSDFDQSEFVERDVLTTARPAARPVTMSESTANRPPSREELDLRVTDAQQQLAELKRKQDELERERAALEEARRRRVELQTGREEMLHHLARGLAVVGHAVATRNTLPILSNVYLGTEDGGLRLVATNLDIAITHWVPAKVEEKG